MSIRKGKSCFNFSRIDKSLFDELSLLTEAAYASYKEQGFVSERIISQGAAMELGAFSISLAVKGIQASKAFYKKFGFTVFMGDISKNW